MKSAVLFAPHDIQIVEKPEPQATPAGYVRVKVKAVGVCGSEIHYYESGRIGDHVLRSPMVIGHEIGGIVEEVGAEVPSSLRPGTVVALEPGIPCGACTFCRQGEYNFCPQIQFFATPPVDGAMQEVILHPAAYTFVADPLTVEEAALAEPLSVGVYAARQLNIDSGDTVLVIGGGPVGLLSALAVESRGATATVVEINPTRIRLGREMGLTIILPEDLPSSFDGDQVLECTGSAAGLQLALRAVKTHGKIALIGLGASDQMKLDALTVAQRGLQVYGIFRYAHTFPAAIQILRAQRTRLGPLIKNNIAIDDVPSFFAQRHYQHSLKTIVTL